LSGYKQMKIPAFMKTIRFRLTIFYLLFFLILILTMVIGINLAIWHDKLSEAGAIPRNPGEFEIWKQAQEGDASQITENIRAYSAIGVLAVFIIGAVGLYFLSGFMLRPVDKISNLASSISFSRLKDRLNYKGPNDELKRLSDTFDDMLTRLDSTVESQKQFIQDASHELRTPIATAITNIEVLEMNPQATIQDYQKLLQILKLSLDRMNNISNGLFVLSEGTQVKANWCKVDLVSLVNEVVDETASRALAKKIRLQWKPPSFEIVMNGDIVYLKQAIFNLVDNAIKYTQAKGSIKIALGVENDNIKIVIADSGIGIKSEDLPRIFDRFFRADKSRSREYGGSGLGLAIVKKIVEEHGGTITVSSIPGQGSSFHISFPLYLKD
jgi:signal transduction histidine kinase